MTPTSPLRFLRAFGWQYQRDHHTARTWVHSWKTIRKPWRDPVSRQWMNMRAALRQQRGRMEVAR